MKRFLKCICLALGAVMISGNLSSAKEKNMQSRMNRERLNIGTYFLQEYARTEQHVKDLADCGIDFVIGVDIDKALLDMFSKYNVGAVVNGVLPGWWGGDGKNAGKMRATNTWDKYDKGVKEFKDHSAIWGVDTGDEPSALDFPFYGEVIDFAYKKLPNQFPYLNLYPNYASVAENNAQEKVNQLGTATYSEHIDKYCQNVGLDYICYDFYMFAAGIPRHYENLRVVANAARSTGRSMWIVLQVNSNKKEKWISLDQLRSQAFSSLAFGAENIIWACYTAGWWHNQVLDKQGNKTEQYDKLKTVNQELHAIAPEYMRFRNTATHFVGFEKGDKYMAAVQDTMPVKELSTGVFQNVKAINGEPLIIGQMTERKGYSQALMIYAADSPDASAVKDVTVSFKCSDRHKVRVVNAPLTLNADGTYSVTIRSCSGALVIAE